MKINKTLILLIFTIVGCNSDKSGIFNEDKIVEVSLNKEAKKALNNISNILNGENYIKSTYSSTGQRSNIFFTLKEDESFLILKTDYYENIDMGGKHNSTYTKFFTDDLNEDNIDLRISNLPYFGGEFGEIKIRSEFNKKDAFIVKRPIVEENGKSTEKVFYTDNLTIILNKENAIKLKQELITFIKFYKNDK